MSAPVQTDGRPTSLSMCDVIMLTIQWGRCAFWCFAKHKHEHNHKINLSMVDIWGSHSAVQEELCITGCDAVLLCRQLPPDASRVLTAVIFGVTILGILVPEYESTMMLQNVILLTKRHGVTFRETGVFYWIAIYLRRSTSNCRPPIYKASWWRHFYSADFYGKNTTV